MDQVAFLFPGQGAQKPGMGRQLYDTSAAARQVFDAAEASYPGLRELCFDGSQEELSRTENAQPCLFAVDLAAASALWESGVEPAALAGFSLGEIPALAFAGMLPFQDAFALVRLRAEAMSACALAHPGGMVAVLGLSGEAVEQACAQVPGTYPVNYNCPGQVVVAGEKEALAALTPRLKAEKARVLPLAVGGPFHTPWMARAGEAMGEFLRTHPLQAPRWPLYANLTGQPYAPPYAQTLCAQVESPVRFQATLEHLWHAGVRTFVETGVGSTLCGFVRKTLPQARAYAVSDAQNLREAMEALS